MISPRVLLAPLLLILTASHVWALVFVVDDAGDNIDAVLDGTCDASGPQTCTLRAAIEEANFAGGGPHTINIVISSGPVTIFIFSPLPTLFASVIIDGSTQIGWVSDPIVTIDGGGSALTAIIASSGGSTFRSLILTDFTGNAVDLFGANNTLVACWISNNGSYGINLTSANNTIDFCVIYLNLSGGVNLSGAGATGNVITNSLIGTDPTGTVAMANFNGIVTAGDNNTFGGSSNLISGNTNIGLLITSSGATGHVVEGNKIGTDINGTAALANDFGVVVDASANCTVGGTTAAKRNIISGNTFAGVRLQNGASANVVRGNYVGTDVNGTAATPNGWGLVADLSTGNTFGGSEGNLVSGNSNDGVLLQNASSLNIVSGNYIGTDVNGTAALANDTGVKIDASVSNTIGGTTAGERNLISGNTNNGVFIDGDASDFNAVQGNYIGTDVTGTLDLGNGFAGIQIFDGDDNLIGGNSAASRNIISGNNTNGVIIAENGNATTGNLVRGNYIGTDVNGTTALGNSFNGVGIDFNASDNSVGGTFAGEGNLIAFNGMDGVAVFSGTGNDILGNSIHSNTGIGIDLSPDGVTGNDGGDGDGGANNLQNFAVVTDASKGSTIIDGTLNSTPSTTFRLEFFANDACDGSGNGEGQTFLGFQNVTTDGTGNVTFTATLTTTPTSVGQFITSTATDPTDNTSEFSQCGVAVAAFVPPNVIPDLVPNSSKSVNEGTTLSFSLSASDPDGDSVSFSASGVPSGAFLSGATFTWTPSFNQSGSYTVIFTASDGKGGKDTDAVSISVVNVNRAPLISAIGTQTVTEDEVLNFTVSAVDFDADPIAISVLDLPAGASFSDDLFTWTPDFTQAGPYSLSFTASDGQGGTDTETIEVVVEDANRLPILTEIGNQIVGEGVTLSLVLAATDPDGQSVSFSMLDPPPGAGILDATFTWTPGFDQAGVYSVTLVATDELGGVGVGGDQHHGRRGR